MLGSIFTLDCKLLSLVAFALFLSVNFPFHAQAQIGYDCSKYNQRALYDFTVREQTRFTSLKPAHTSLRWDTNSASAYIPPLLCLKDINGTCVHGSLDVYCGCVCVCDSGWAGQYCNVTAATAGTPFGLMWTARRRKEFSRGFFLNGTLQDAAGRPVNDFTIELYALMQYPLSNFADVSPSFFEFRDTIHSRQSSTNTVSSYTVESPLTVPRFMHSLLSYYSRFRRQTSFEYYSTTDGSRGEVGWHIANFGQVVARVDPNIPTHIAIVVKTVNTTDGGKGQVVEMYSDSVVDDFVFHKQFQRYDDRSIWFGSFQRLPNFVDSSISDERIFPFSLEGMQYDEIRIWNRALSQDEIVRQSRTPLTGTEPGLLAYFPFDDPSEKTVIRNRAAGGNGWLDALVTVGTNTDPTLRYSSSEDPPLLPDYAPSSVRTHTLGIYAHKASSITFYSFPPDDRVDVSPRVGSVMVPMPDGRLLLVGGAPGMSSQSSFISLNSTTAPALFSASTTSVWTFNKTSGRPERITTVETSLPSQRSLAFHTATLVDNGQRLFVIGGSYTQGQLFVLDTATMTWSVPNGAAAFNTATGPLFGHSATLIGRKIYVFGGGTFSNGQFVGTSRMFSLDIDSVQFETISPANGDLNWPEPRAFHGALVRQTLSRFFVIGGVNDIANTANLTKVWEFNAITRIFSAPRVTGTLPRNLFGVSFSTFGESSLIMFGGVSSPANVSMWHLRGFTRDFLSVVDAIPVSALDSTDEMISFRQVQLDKMDGGFPFHRIAHAAAYDSSSGGLYVHGGVSAVKRQDKFSIRSTGVGGDFISADQASFIRLGCPRGLSKYLNTNGTLPERELLAACAVCPPATYQPYSAAERPILERLICLPCPLGTYSNATGAAQCVPCPVGFYMDATNATACQQCPVDTNTITTGTTSLTGCFPVPKAAITAFNPVTTGIAVAVALVAVAGVIIVIVFIYRRSRKVTDRLISQQKTAKLLEIDESKFAFKFLKASDLQLGEELGHGSFGTVYKGDYHGKPVAIKVSSPGNQQAVEDFLSEADVMMQLEPHPNVLGLVGICISGSSAMVVLELADSGSLDKLISKGSPFPDELQLRAFISEIVFGLRHLHASGLIHRDLAARNILLVKDPSGKYTPKIADFGMSRIVDPESEGGKTATTFGPVPWMAPEAIGELKYSTASDIWSLGITIWELATGLDPAQQMDIATLAVNIRDHGYHPRIQAFFPSWLEKVLNGCWATDPLDRLTLDEILRILDPNVVVTTAAKKIRKRKVEEAQAESVAVDPELLAQVEQLRQAIEAAEKKNNAIRKEIEALGGGKSESTQTSAQPLQLTKKQSKRAWARSVAPNTLKNVAEEQPPALTKKKSSRRNQAATVQQPNN